jgi:chromosome segregation ATPase
MGTPEPKDLRVAVENLQRHLAEHREIAEERETRIIRLETALGRIEAEYERLRGRLAVRIALRLAAIAQPVFRAVRRLRQRSTRPPKIRKPTR